MSDALTTCAAVGECLEGLHGRASGPLQPFAADLERMLGAARSLESQLASLHERLEKASGNQEIRRIRHDLRTPIGQLQGYAELLVEEAEDEDLGEWTNALRGLLQDVFTLRAQTDGLCVDAPSDSSGSFAKPTRSGSEGGRPSPWAAESEADRAVVLVVDDDSGNRAVLRRRLERDGFVVLDTDNGNEALRLAGSVPIDVVLLDILMPQLDGYETLERLKANATTDHIPVIMLTSLSDQESIARCLEAGAEDHLPKPFDAVLLRARLGNCLEKKRSRDRERSYLERLEAEKKRADDLLHEVIPIGVALASERDEARLLQRILREARRFCCADGGALHLRQGDRLQLAWIQVDSLGLTSTDATGLDSTAGLLHAGPKSPPAAAAAGAHVCIPRLDVARREGEYALQRVDRFDATHGYQTRAVLCLPLRNGASVVGVLELWNPDVPSANAEPFGTATIEILDSLSSLAAAALDSYRRESALQRKIDTLQIRVDHAKRSRAVHEITDTDYFRELRAKAAKLRKANR